MSGLQTFELRYTSKVRIEPGASMMLTIRPGMVGEGKVVRCERVGEDWLVEWQSERLHMVRTDGHS